MTNKKQEKDEHIEVLYYMKESQKDSIDDLKSGMGQKRRECIMVWLMHTQN